MTISQIEYFIEVASAESFTKAAEKLYITHQALSKHIRVLESELGLVLFDRTNRRKTALTEEGRILYNEWKPLLAKGHQAYQKALEEKSRKENTIRIGIQDIDNVRYAIAPVLKEFCSKNPLFHTSFTVGMPEDLMLKMENQELDMCCIFSYDDIEEGFQYVDIGAKKAIPVIAMSVDNPLATQEKVTVQDLKNETLLIMEEEYSKYIHDLILNDFAAAGVTPARIRAFNKFNEMELALTLNEGVTIMNDIQCQKRPESIKYYYFKNDDSYVKILLLYKESKWMSIAQSISAISKED